MPHRSATGSGIEKQGQSNRQCDNKAALNKEEYEGAGYNETQPPTSVRHSFSETFTVGAAIGKGAYAPVYLAIHRPSGKAVAVKIYKGFVNMERERRLLITREVYIMRKLHHENIVKFGVVYNEKHALFIVMQHLSGGSLHNLIRNHPKGRLSEVAARKYFKDALSGLHYMHSKGIIHRDLKLENLLLDDKGRVRIIDFGFASILKPGMKCRMACGTPSYMPPEILEKSEYIGTCADMWSLGVVLFAMLHGCYPFTGSQPAELYRQIKSEDFSISTRLSASARSLILGLLSKVPTDRLTTEQALQHPWLKEA